MKFPKESFFHCHSFDWSFIHCFCLYLIVITYIFNLFTSSLALSGIGNVQPPRIPYSVCSSRRLGRRPSAISLRARARVACEGGAARAPLIAPGMGAPVAAPERKSMRRCCSLRSSAGTSRVRVRDARLKKTIVSFSPAKSIQSSTEVHGRGLSRRRRSVATIWAKTGSSGCSASSAPLTVCS